jgi:hypothetical protein
MDNVQKHNICIVTNVTIARQRFGKYRLKAGINHCWTTLR